MKDPTLSWRATGAEKGDHFYPSGRGRKAPLEEIGKPSKWITLNDYRVLTQTGDIDLS